MCHLCLQATTLFAMDLEHEGPCLLHSAWVMPLSPIASGFTVAVTHGRPSFSLRLAALPRDGHAAFHYPCILGSSECQWRARVVCTPRLSWITAQWTGERAFLLEALTSLSPDSHVEIIVKRTALAQR